MQATREEKMSDAFLVIGSQYYTLAVYCAEHMYLPVGVTLFHHAIEMLLKGCLAKSKTSAELKKLGHDLEFLWGEFKSVTADDKLTHYDTTILRLNQVELIRYPDSIVDKGYALSVRLGTPIPLDIPGTQGLPQYLVNVSDLNEIVALIFKLYNIPVTPYFKSAPIELINALPVALRPAR